MAETIYAKNINLTAEDLLLNLSMILLTLLILIYYFNKGYRYPIFELIDKMNKKVHRKKLFLTSQKKKT